MNTMNISLPVKMKAYVEKQVKTGEYGTASEYVRHLIREDQERKVRNKVDTMLLEALESGKPIEVTPEYWKEKKKRLLPMNGSKRKRA